MQGRIPVYNGDPHGLDGKLLSNFIPFSVLKAQQRRVYGDEIPLPDARWIGLRAKYCRLNQPKYFPINWLSWLDLVYKP